FARIHWQNLANFGVLAVEFGDPADHDAIDQDDVLKVTGIRDSLGSTDEMRIENVTKGTTFPVRHRLSPRQVADVLAGGLIPRLAAEGESDVQEAKETVLQHSGEIS
ncbi:aconitate hydratase, partial [Streptomyces sp. SID10244]|nr:aconitate hydratase [Streptomyces sp. SID10244]